VLRRFAPCSCLHVRVAGVSQIHVHNGGPRSCSRVLHVWLYLAAASCHKHLYRVCTASTYPFIQHPLAYSKGAVQASHNGTGFACEVLSVSTGSPLFTRVQLWLVGPCLPQQCLLGVNKLQRVAIIWCFQHHSNAGKARTMLYLSSGNGMLPWHNHTVCTHTCDAGWLACMASPLGVPGDLRAVSWSSFALRYAFAFTAGN
jgi:hypothetical protein